MITCVAWIPSKAAKEWPDKLHEIPIKNLPIQVDDFMSVKPEIVDQFLEDSDSDNDIKDDTQSQTNTRKRKLDALQNVDSDNHQSKKSKTNAANHNLINHGNDGNDADNEQELDETSDNQRLSDIEDIDEFTNKVLEGYDEEPLDFLSRIAGLHSGIGIGPTDYSYNSLKKDQRSRDKKHRIIRTENIYDTKNDSEIEDIHILDSDEVFICLGSNEDRESASLGVHVFDTKLRTFYEHHSITLPAFPLCCKWLSNAHTLGTNLLAIGSIEESIEIFDLDVMDALEPLCSLGGRVSTDAGDKLLRKWNENIMFNYMEMSERQKEMTLGKLKRGSHSDSVLCLDWTALKSEHLFSASGDRSVKVWDLQTQKCVKTWECHSDKVQQVRVGMSDPNLVMSGGFDKKVFLCDMRANNAKFKQKWSVNGEVETLLWHPKNENFFVCSLDNGYVYCFDVRKANETEKSVWHMRAHKKAVTGLCFKKDKSDMFATASLDNTIKVWHQSECGQKPVCVAQQRNNAMGGIFSIDFAPKRFIPTVLIIGGQESFGMWDVAGDANVKRFEQSKDGKSESALKEESESNSKGQRYQHHIMEQTFNYSEKDKIVINKNETIDDFLDSD